jgi:hypothetical protein
MDERPTTNDYRSGRLAILCGAALAAAVFTPVPAKAIAAMQPGRPAVTAMSTVHTTRAGSFLAEALISTGMAGLGLAAGGLVIVAVRRRRY